MAGGRAGFGATSSGIRPSTDTPPRETYATAAPTLTSTSKGGSEAPTRPSRVEYLGPPTHETETTKPRPHPMNEGPPRPTDLPPIRKRRPRGLTRPWMVSGRFVAGRRGATRGGGR